MSQFECASQLNTPNWYREQNAADSVSEVKKNKLFDLKHKITGSPGEMQSMSSSPILLINKPWIICLWSEPTVANTLDSSSIDWSQRHDYSSMPEINENMTATVDREDIQVIELLDLVHLRQC